MKYLAFLKEKIKSYSFKDLLFLETESLVFGILTHVPTTFGVILRAIALKAFAQRCGGFAWLQQRATFVHMDRITFGKNFGVNTGAYINGVGGIEFGDYVLIGNNVTISSGMHPIDNVNIPVFSRPAVPKKIVIEDDVWIGAGAIIMPGVRLRKGTIIGANAVVTGDTEEYAVMAGAPARLLRLRNKHV
ncbi:acetyltransferase-like isoleucine patch superfamily enzyme [Silvimonas terrae]|uniref:Acetyltransferase-like isoleucine patch superfamily enzyme n=1 Tax=Silvimonas terrae TaxID=300266 RepID=A0A840RJY6_9NEIS|nr:acyltransferase [Silvimonas terrae]MBB5192471.1 acetyltransferase-like isoleucine patch superfamily enzyme [Silvimonas terrae]